MSVVTKLANGIKVATVNNGVKRAQVGVWSHGSGQEDMNDVGVMNMLSNCVNLTANPLVQAKTDRSATTFKSIGKNATVGLDRIADALSKASNPETLEAAKDVAHGQAISLDDCWKQMAVNYAMNTGFMHTALGKDTMGSSNLIDTLTTGEVDSALKHMNQTGMVVAAVGDVDHDAFCKQVEAKFGNLWSTGGLKTPAIFTGSRYSHRFDSTDFGISSCIHHVPPPNHKFGMDFEVGSKIIGCYDPKKAGNAHSAINLRARFGHKSGDGMPNGIPGSFPAGQSLKCEYLDTSYEVYGGNAVLRWTLKTLGQDSGLNDEATERVIQYIGNMYRRTSDFQVQMGKNQVVMDAALAMQNDPLQTVGQSVYDYGYIRDANSVKSAVSKVNLTSLEHAWSIYLVDQEIATGQVGCVDKLIQLNQLRTFTNPKQTYW